MITKIIFRNRRYGYARPNNAGRAKVAGLTITAR
jgi:hypothetical protein